jgi:hypothetical protein
VFAAAQKLLPDVTSFTNLAEFSYIAGLAHPMDPFPAAIRAALIFESMPAKTGHDAEVPDMAYALPPM